jgi:hypothetical protein
MNRICQTPSSIAEIRQRGAYWISASALFFLVFSVLLFIWMWVRAYMHGGIPQTGWGQYEGNHGPWRHSYDLRGAWWQILNLQFYAFVLGLVSIVFKPKRRASIITVLAFVSGCLFLVTHYWLVD